MVTERDVLYYAKPEWMKIKLPADSYPHPVASKPHAQNGLHSAREEATLPKPAECFNHGTATYCWRSCAICTRRVRSGDVAHALVAPDAEEPQKLAQTIADMALRYAVITSVDRDDLRDGGAQHLLTASPPSAPKARRCGPETPVPDFRGRMDRARWIP